MFVLDTRGTHVYLIGIKGAGMAGLAQILQGLGYQITGSDIEDSFFTDAILKEQGITFFEGFDSSHIPEKVDWAISSSAYISGTSNPEIEELKKRGVPLVSYAEALGHFFNKAFGIAVTGTHGKSTTSAMIAYILEQANRDPFAVIGASLINWKSNARVATSYKLLPTSYFVIEADEYREQFLHYRPALIAITNIDYDHSDYFATPDDYQKAFAKFKAQAKPQCIVVEPLEKKQRPHFTLQLIGEHNQENAHTAFEVCKQLGIPQDSIRQALASFKGTKRRLETIGEYQGAQVIDDYAHHPREIRASLEALRQTKLGKKLIVLFHPHTYTRTEKFLKDFAASLSLADEVYLLDIYASAREAKGHVSSDDIIEELQVLGQDAINLHTIPQATDYFKKHLTEHDILVTMGAGDVFRVAEQLTNT